MRLIILETTTGAVEVINANQIVSIVEDASGVVVTMSNDHQVRTKFTDVEHAADYIERAKYTRESLRHYNE
jgi:DNA-binding cell septation regulator SpoVG